MSVPESRSTLDCHSGTLTESSNVQCLMCFVDSHTEIFGEEALLSSVHTVSPLWKLC